MLILWKLFIAVNNTFGKGDIYIIVKKKKNSKDENAITPRSFNFIIRNAMNNASQETGTIEDNILIWNWWGGRWHYVFFYRNDGQRQRPATPGRCIYARICTVTGGARRDLWPGKLFRRDSRHSVIHRCGTRLMTQLLRQAPLFGRQRVGLASSGEREFLRNCGGRNGGEVNGIIWKSNATKFMQWHIEVFCFYSGGILILRAKLLQNFTV